MLLLPDVPADPAVEPEVPLPVVPDPVVLPDPVVVDPVVLPDPVVVDPVEPVPDPERFPMLTFVRMKVPLIEDVDDGEDELPLVPAVWPALSARCRQPITVIGRF